MIKPILIPADKCEAGIVIQGNSLTYHAQFFTQEYLKSINAKSFDIILVDTEAKIDEGSQVYFGEHVIEIMRISIPNGSVTFFNPLDGKLQTINGLEKFKLVISSTNKSHKLPQLSSQSIQLLINYYNEHKCMPESVDVERENQKLDLVIGKEYLLDKTGWKINIPETKGIYIRSIKVTDHREETGFHVNAKVLIDPKEETIIGCSENCLYLDKPIKILKLNQQGEVDITILEVEEKLYTEDEVVSLCDGAFRAGSSKASRRLDFDDLTPAKIKFNNGKEYFNAKKK